MKTERPLRPGGSSEASRIDGARSLPLEETPVLAKRPGSLRDRLRRIDERDAQRELKQLVEDARYLAHRILDLKTEVSERPRLRLVAASQTIHEAIWELKRAGKLLP